MNDIIKDIDLPLRDPPTKVGPAPRDVAAKIKVPAKLPFCFPWELQERAPEERWLIEGAWTAEGVGVIGGAPKTCKTWTALEMAVAVATGTLFLGTYTVRQQDRVLVFLAEDPEWSARDRIAGIAEAHGTSIDRLDHLKLVTRRQMRLDRPEDQKVLEAMIEDWRPSLLVVDPVVRVHGGDENSASDISELLGFFRVLQRRFNMAVALTHHTRKAAASNPGQALRGSTDFHGWGDSFLHLIRVGDVVKMAVEHRSAASMGPIALTLAGDPVHLQVVDDETPTEGADEVVDSLEARVLELLIQAGPLTTAEIQGEVGGRTTRVLDALHDLQRVAFIENRRRKEGGGWRFIG